MIKGQIHNIFYGRKWQSVQEMNALFSDLNKNNIQYIINLLPNDPSIKEEKKYFDVICLPILDFSIPGPDFEEKIKQISNIKENIFVHCLAGIGRTSLVVAELLKLKGKTVEEALEYTQKYIGGPETQEQIDFVRRKGKYVI